MTRSTHVHVLAMTLLCLTACSPRKSAPKKANGQTLTDSNIIDHDLKFGFYRPGKSWRMTDKEGISALTPDAVAGISVVSGVWRGSTGG